MSSRPTDAASIRRSFERVLARRILVIDGAMGTALQERDLSAADFGGEELLGCNEVLVRTRPDVIREIHEEYLAAGADCIETNTFGSTPLVLAEYDITEEAEEAVRREPLMGGFIHACVLHHRSLAKALSYRFSAKLFSNEMPAVLLREIAEEAYGETPELLEIAQADLAAVVERDPACHRFIQPLLYFKGYQALQAHRLAHWPSHLPPAL